MRHQALKIIYPPILIASGAIFARTPTSVLTSSVIQFGATYDDLSTEKGFQFKFHRDRCRNGYMSRFQPNAIDLAGRLLQAANSLFGGLGGAENAAYHI